MSRSDLTPHSSTTSLRTYTSSPSPRNYQQNTTSPTNSLLPQPLLSRSPSRYSSPTPIADLDDNKYERKSLLPSFNLGKVNSTLNFSGKMLSRFKNGRIRWLIILFLVVLIGSIYSTKRGGIVENLTSNIVGEKVMDPDDYRAPDSKEKSTSSPINPSSLDISPIDINVQSLPLSNEPILPFEKFLAYTPHSGYHNQRISLENALTLAFMLNRTLLLPPVWLGHAIPYISYDKLQTRVQLATKIGLDRCKSFGEGGSEDIIPRECEGYFDWTLVGWDFLVDLSQVHTLVKVRNRWNLTSEWLEEDLEMSNLGEKEQDVFYMKDSMMYEYKFYDSKEDLEPLAKFVKRTDIADLKEASDHYRLIHIGSLFGTSRIRGTEEENFNARSLFRKAMVFKNQVVDEIVEEIRDRLGGSGNYYGLHLRVGDGVFQHEAKKNMNSIWEQLCVGKMKLKQEVCDSIKSKALLYKRSEPVNASTLPSNLIKRASNSRPQAEGAYHHTPLPPLPIIHSRTDSLLHSSLTCRSSLHTDPQFLPFNSPLFIATDSKIPTSDPNLSIFFKAFPCTFILNDFSSQSTYNSIAVAGLSRLTRLRNVDDFVPMAQFLYPQLDAGISAYGRSLIGTPLSTYSRFATDVLHQVYHGWEIIERG